MAARAQMTGRVTGTLCHGRQLAPVTPLHRQRGANNRPRPPPQSLLLFQCDSNLWLCCEGYWNGWLTHFQLTDTIIHCLYWGLWVCAYACAHARGRVCFVGTVPVRQPP